jgi:hypothetical protein
MSGFVELTCKESLQQLRNSPEIKSYAGSAAAGAAGATLAGVASEAGEKLGHHALKEGGNWF